MKTNLHLVCAGTPTPTRERFGSCLVLEVDEERLMFDCGPAATWKLTRFGLVPTDIDRLFFTHHHSDHNSDYPCFLLTRWDHERGRIPPLRVYGPAPTVRITERLIGPEGAFADDLRCRIEHPASQKAHQMRGGDIPRPGPRPKIREIASGDEIETRSCTVRCVDSIHLQPLMDCLAFRIDWSEGSLVVTGDTGRSEEIERLAQGAGTMVVNVWDIQSAIPDEFRVGFCGTLDAAGMARAASVGRLVVTHQAANLCLPEVRTRALAEMAEVFGGEIIFSQEGQTLELS